MDGQEADMLENMKNACEAAAMLYLCENQAFITPFISTTAQQKGYALEHAS